MTEPTCPECGEELVEVTLNSKRWELACLAENCDWHMLLREPDSPAKLHGVKTFSSRKAFTTAVLNGHRIEPAKGP